MEVQQEPTYANPDSVDSMGFSFPSPAQSDEDSVLGHFFCSGVDAKLSSLGCPFHIAFSYCGRPACRLRFHNLLLLKGVIVSLTCFIAPFHFLLNMIILKLTINANSNTMWWKLAASRYI